MPININQIKNSSNDCIVYFKNHGALLDYSIESLKQLDNYFEKYLVKSVPKEGEEIDKETQGNLFSVACYLGETLRKNIVGSAWEIDEMENIPTQDVILKLSENNLVWPFERTLKRFFNGSEDGIYAYGYFLTKDFFEKNKLTNGNQTIVRKNWWKFW